MRTLRGARVSVCRLWIAAMLACAPGAAAQTAPASVRGTVQDQTGAVVPGVRVILVDAAGASRGDTRTDGAGTFVFAGIVPGPYEIRAEREGFAAGVVRLRVPRAGVVIAPKIVLQVAGINQEITVGETTPLTTAASGNRDAIAIDRDTLEGLPIFDRDVIGTLSRFIDPGAVGSGGVTLVVDGIEARKAGVSPSAIQEIKINQDPYSAEFQRPGRGRIEVVTKAGSDAYHGSAELTFRDAHLNARDPFAPSRPPEQRRIYEGIFGGPIRGGKNTSFLFTLERREEDLQAIVFAATPGGLVNAIVAQPVRSVEGSATWTHQAGKHHTFTLRSNVEIASEPNQNVGGTTLPEAAVDDRSDEENLIVGHRWIVNSKLLSEFRLLAGREIGSTLSRRSGPRIVVLDAFTGGGAQATQRSTEYHFQLTQNVTYLHGRHLLKVGFAVPDFSRRGFDDVTNREGTFTFASLEDYAEGRPFSLLQQRGDGRIVFLQQVYAAFVQDQITLTPHLSAGVGVRYDWQNIFADSNNVAPRLSLAYAAGTRTVVRGGAGWFYDRAGDGAIREVLRSEQARLLRYLLLNPAYPDPFAGAASDATPPRSLVQLAPSIRIPYTVQYGIGIERQLRRRTTLAVNYVGARGVDLFRSVDVNAPPPPLFDARPNPAFGQIREIQASGRQQTHSVQVMLRGRLAPRVQGSIQYTAGAAHNDTSGINALPANNHDLASEWGRADFDQRQRVEALAQFKGGAWLNLGIAVSAASGRPYSLRTGRDDYHTGQTNARPPGVARNTQQGPAYANLDLRWSREVKLAGDSKDDEEGLAIRFGVDAFNVLNHVNYAGYVGTLTSPFLGRPIAALPPRRLQLTAGVTF